MFRVVESRPAAEGRAGLFGRIGTVGVVLATVLAGAVTVAPAAAAAAPVPVPAAQSDANRPSAVQLAAASRMASFDAQLVSLVNQARAKAGVSPVTEATGLTALSVWWSTRMADGATGYELEHNPNAWTMVTTYGASNRTTWGENVAAFSANTSATDLFNAYMNSPGHRANILSAKYHFIGMGTMAGSRGAYNTMEFTDRVESGQAVAPPSRGVSGRVLVRSGSSPVAGVKVSIRDSTCGRALADRVTGAAGTISVVALPGTYCAVTVAVPSGYRVPAAVRFTVAAGAAFTAPVSLTSFAGRGVVLVRSGSTRVAGVKVSIRDSSCGRVLANRVTGAAGTIPVVALAGVYCAVTVGVPSGYRVPAAVRFTVAAGATFTAPVSLTAFAGRGAVLARSGSRPMAGVKVSIRDYSCARKLADRVTGAAGTIAVIALPGVYCAVPLAVPSGHRVPAPVRFAVVAGRSFTVPITVR